MKKIILLLLALCYSIPGFSFAAVSSHDIHIEWFYNFQPFDEKVLSGYHLYKEGVRVCTTDIPEGNTMDCMVDSEPGTFNFTLTAFHSDGTESPHSPSYSFYLGPEEVLPPADEGSHSFTFTWDANENNDIISGFRIYLNNTLLCETNDPSANEVTCRSNILQSIMAFTITTLFTDNTESSPSNLLTFDPFEYPQFLTTKRLTFSWEYPVESDLAGFKIYQDSVQICETSNPADRQITCTSDISSAAAKFAITAFNINGIETILSNVLTYTTDTSPLPTEPAVLQAIITSNAREGKAPLAITFDSASSTGEISSFSWSFGDGATSDTSNVDHLYTIAGTYTTKLTVSDTSGNTSVATTVISVTEGVPVDTPPRAVISSSTALGQSPLSVSFNGGGSSAPDSEITNYQWEFGDGSSATGSDISHVFIKTGTFSTTLTVTNSAGLTDSVSTPVIVTSPPPAENKPPRAVFSATPTTGNTPLTVSFNASGSSDSDGTISSYTWQFGDGSLASGVSTTHTYTDLATFTATLTVTDNDGAKSSTTTSITVAPESAPPEFNIELGEISVNSNWARVKITSSFQNPIVIAGPPSSVDSSPCVVRLRNISPTGFDIKLSEWEYLDESHAYESISYLIMEKGHFTLPDGTQVEAGTFDGSTSFKQVAFFNTFNVDPVIVSSIATNNETDTISGRIRNISKTSFEYYYQEQEKNQTIHVAETINYVAWEISQGTFGNISYEVATTGDTVTHNLSDITFQTGFSSAPLFLADMQSTDGTDTAALRMQDITINGVQIHVEEEQSNDSETEHTSETVGYLALGSMAAEQDLPAPVNNVQKLFTINWTFDDSIEGVSGFFFYQNNELICESNNVADRSISCIAPLLDAEVLFTMTALINNVETEHSSLLQISPDIFKQTATFKWTFEQQQENAIAGFGIYVDSEMLCDTDDPTIRTLSCETFALAQGTAFTIKAIYPDTSTTNASNIITY